MHSILLLDDERHVLSALRRALRIAFGNAVATETYTDPHEALDRVGAHAFDLVVSDYRMPSMDGIQFLHFVRGLQPTALRMIVSASTEMNGVLSAVNDINVFRYIVKPWNTELLVEDVRSALAQADTDREQRSLAQAMRVRQGGLAPDEVERRRLEALEPGLTQVSWGPNGEVLMPHLQSGIE